jgi:beta-mannosidase
LPTTKENPLWVHSSLWWLPKDRFKRELRGLKGAARMKKFVQLSQEFQSRILALAAGSCKDRFPRCGGFIIWMGHDCFPCLINTSVIDVEGNPKPAYHAVANVFRRRQRDERISTTSSRPT